MSSDESGSDSIAQNQWEWFLWFITHVPGVIARITPYCNFSLLWKNFSFLFKTAQDMLFLLSGQNWSNIMSQRILGTYKNYDRSFTEQNRTVRQRKRSAMLLVKKRGIHLLTLERGETGRDKVAGEHAKESPQEESYPAIQTKLYRRYPILLMLIFLTIVFALVNVYFFL